MFALDSSCLVHPNLHRFRRRVREGPNITLALPGQAVLLADEALLGSIDPLWEVPAPVRDRKPD